MDPEHLLRDCASVLEHAISQDILRATGLALLDYYDTALVCARSSVARTQAVGLCALGYIANNTNDHARIVDAYHAIQNSVPTGFIPPFDGSACLYGVYTQRAGCAAALSKDPSYWLAHLVMSFVAYLHRSTAFLEELRWPTDSRDWVSKAHQLNPDSFVVYIVLSRRVSFRNIYDALPPRTRRDLLLRAIALDPHSVYGYEGLAYLIFFDIYANRTRWPHEDRFECTVSPVQLHDGRSLTVLQLCFEILARDLECAYAYGCLFAYMSYAARECEPRSRDHMCIPGRGSMTIGQIGAEAVRYDPCMPYIRPDLIRYAVSWAPHLHEVFHETRGDKRLDVLFGTLLMAINRLEARGVLVESHDSMLEDMLGGWTLRDVCARV